MYQIRQQPGQSPVYGFEQNPQRHPMAQFIDTVAAALNDPRTAALLAPGMGLLRAPGLVAQAGRAIPNMWSERGSVPFGWLRRERSMDPRPEFNMNVPLSHVQEQLPGTPNYKSYVEGIQDLNALAGH